MLFRISINGKSVDEDNIVWVFTGQVKYAMKRDGRTFDKLFDVKYAECFDLMGAPYAKRHISPFVLDEENGVYWLCEFAQ